MFANKKKKELKILENKIKELKLRSEDAITSTKQFISKKNFNMEMIEEIENNLINIDLQWSEIDFNNNETIKKTINKLLLKISSIKEDFISKRNFLASLEDFSMKLENFNLRIQDVAKKIPITQLIQDLEFIKTEIESMKEDLNSLEIIPDEFLNNYFSDNEKLKYEIIFDKRDSTLKKVHIITNSLSKRKEKLEVTIKELDVSEEKKKLFNWIDTFEQRYKKYENRVDSFYERLEEIESIVSLELFESELKHLKSEKDILEPPKVKTPEVKKQVEKISIKYLEKVKSLEEKFVTLEQLINKKLINIIADKRSDRLIRKFLSTKRVPKGVFIELIKTEEEFATKWLKTLPDEEPLRLQETDTFVALSMARVQEGKQLYEYLTDVMIRFTLDESNNNEIFSSTTEIFKEAEKFDKNYPTK